MVIRFKTKELEIRSLYFFKFTLDSYYFSGLGSFTAKPNIHFRLSNEKFDASVPKLWNNHLQHIEAICYLENIDCFRNIIFAQRRLVNLHSCRNSLFSILCLLFVPDVENLVSPRNVGCYFCDCFLFKVQWNNFCWCFPFSSVSYSIG